MGLRRSSEASTLEISGETGKREVCRISYTHTISYHSRVRPRAASASHVSTSRFRPLARITSTPYCYAQPESTLDFQILSRRNLPPVLHLGNLQAVSGRGNKARIVRPCRHCTGQPNPTQSLQEGRAYRYARELSPGRLFKAELRKDINEEPRRWPLGVSIRLHLSQLTDLCSTSVTFARVPFERERSAR